MLQRYGENLQELQQSEYAISVVPCEHLVSSSNLQGLVAAYNLTFE
jgi:hypothetical protein